MGFRGFGASWDSPMCGFLCRHHIAKENPRARNNRPLRPVMLAALMQIQELMYSTKYSPVPKDGKKGFDTGASTSRGAHTRVDLSSLLMSAPSSVSMGPEIGRKRKAIFPGGLTVEPGRRPNQQQTVP